LIIKDNNCPCHPCFCRIKRLMKWGIFAWSILNNFLQSLVPTGKMVWEEKLEMWKTYRQQTDDRCQVMSKSLHDLFGWESEIQITCLFLWLIADKFCNFLFLYYYYALYFFLFPNTLFWNFGLSPLRYSSSMYSFLVHQIQQTIRIKPGKEK